MNRWETYTTVSVLGTADVQRALVSLRPLGAVARIALGLTAAVRDAVIPANLKPQRKTTRSATASNGS